MNKQLFGAVVAVNLLELTEGKKWDAIKRATVTSAKFIRDKAPSVVKGTGIISKYVGKNLKVAGKGIKAAGEAIKTNKKFALTEPKDPATGNLTTSGKISHALNVARDSVSRGVGTVTKGVGSVISAAGTVPKKVGEKIEDAGNRWATHREDIAKNKADAEKAAQVAQKNTEDQEIKNNQQRQIENSIVERKKAMIQKGKFDKKITIP